MKSLTISIASSIGYPLAKNKEIAYVNLAKDNFKYNLFVKINVLKKLFQLELFLKY